MTFYSDMADTATELLAEFGIAMQLQANSSSEYAPGGTVVATVTTEEVKGVLLDYEQSERDGSMIRQEDQRVYVSPDAATAPKTGHKLIINGDQFEVINSRPLSPAGVVLLHDVQVRR